MVMQKQNQTQEPETDEHNAEVLEMYQSGLKAWQIAEMLKMPESTVRYILTKN